jgi:hypothetical protein
MNAYYIAEGEQVTGPFVEDQLMNMWRLGQITANAQVCLEGTEEWVPIRTEINTIEAFRPKITRDMRGVYSTEQAVKPSKSEGTAALLTLLLVGAGHVYAGEAGRGLCFLIIAVITAVTFWPLGLVTLLVAVMDSMRAARQAV